MPELHYTDAHLSSILKANIDKMETVAVAKLIRNERPSMSLANCIYAAKIMKELYRLGVIRGKVVANA